MPSAIPRPAQALIALLLALGLSFGVASLAHAAQPSVTYVNDSQGVRLVFEPSPDNLLPSLNDVMPGDEVSSSLMVENAAGNAETVRLYVRSLGYSKGSEELLSHLSLTVRKNGSPVSDDRASVPGGLAAWTFLGQFDPGEKASLKVTLKVPIELDSSHMNTEGVFKWEFLAEEVGDGTVDPGPPGPVDPKPQVGS